MVVSNVTRTVILHYHLFKNAGTSVDRILSENFGAAWESREFGTGSVHNTHLVEQWIRNTPHGAAYSSHTMVGPLPRVDGVKILPIVLMRDPIERIKSAYIFERLQRNGSWESMLAQSLSFEGYCAERLAQSGDRQCRNFHCSRLSSLILGEGTELDHASLALREFALVGRVEEFDTFLARLKIVADEFFPKFHIRAVWENKSDAATFLVEPQFLEQLRSVNLDDYNLLAYFTLLMLNQKNGQRHP